MGTLFLSYIISAFRNLRKNKLFSLINILGLALGMACCIIICQYVIYETSYDRFHPNYESTYRLQYNMHGEDGTFQYAAAVPAIGPELKSNFPEVLEFSRAFKINGLILKDEIAFRQELLIADASWLHMFEWNLLKGDKATALKGPGKAVITKSTAKKFFGEEDPLGKVIDWKTEWVKQNEFIVSGIIEDVPSNSHVKFDVLLSYPTLLGATQSSHENSWTWLDFHTYVQLEKETDLEALKSKLDAHLVNIRGEIYSEYNYRQEFVFQPLADIHLKSNLLKELEPEENGDADSVYFLSLIAAFILAIAWINYINLASVKSLERGKEVGVRKVLGAQKSTIVTQFIFESILVNFIAAVIAFIIVAFSIPFFNGLTNTQLRLALIINSSTWLLVVLIFLLGAVFSSLYPALVMSSFKPIVTLKGKVLSSNRGIVLRKGLVIFQFLASVVLIAGTIVVYQQMKYVKNRDLGFELSNTLVFEAPSNIDSDSLYSVNYRAFKNEALRIPNVQAVSGTSHLPGIEIFWNDQVRRPTEPITKNRTINAVEIDHDYFPSFKINLISGRNFSSTFTNENQKVILNAAAAEFLGFENFESAINEKLIVSRLEKQIIGVVEDFNQMSLKKEVTPIVFWFKEDNRSLISIKYQGSSGDIILPALKDLYTQFFPRNPVDHFFLDQHYNKQYIKEDQFGSVFSIFSILAIMVSCLGLLGLSAYTAIQKTKEIGIRKTLGASILNILLLLTKEYIWLILFAVVLGIPLVYFGMEKWLAGFAYRVDISWVVFLATSLLVVSVAVLTVGLQVYKTAKSNPSQSLRYE